MICSPRPLSPSLIKSRQGRYIMSVIVSGNSADFHFVSSAASTSRWHQLGVWHNGQGIDARQGSLCCNLAWAVCVLEAKRKASPTLDHQLEWRRRFGMSTLGNDPKAIFNMSIKGAATRQCFPNSLALKWLMKTSEAGKLCVPLFPQISIEHFTWCVRGRPTLV